MEILGDMLDQCSSLFQGSHPLPNFHPQPFLRGSDFATMSPIETNAPLHSSLRQVRGGEVPARTALLSEAGGDAVCNAFDKLSDAERAALTRQTETRRDETEEPVSPTAVLSSSSHNGWEKLLSGEKVRTRGEERT